MNLGELYFSLGFKAEGQSEAVSFEKTIEKTKTTSDQLQVSIDALAEAIKNLGKPVSQDNNDQNKRVGIFAALSKKLTDLVGKTAAYRIQLVATSTAIGWFTKRMSESAVFLDRMESATGISADNIQRLGAMASQSGSSVNDLAGTLSMLQQESINIKLGRGGNIGVWQFLGIDPHQNPEVVLDKLAERLKTMPKALGTVMAKDLGLSDDMIYFLRNKENLKPISDETLLTDREIKRLKDFNFYFNRVWDQTQRVLQKVAAALTPVVNVALYGFDRISAMFGRYMNRLQPYLEKFERFMPVLGVAFMYLAKSLSPTVFALTMLLVALEDLDTYMRGGDSIFGRMLDWLKNIKEVIIDVVSFFSTLANIATFGKFESNLMNWVGKTSEKLTGMVDDMNQRDMFAERIAGRYNLNNPNQTNYVTINVDGSKDPKETVSQIEKNWNSIVNGTYFQMAGGSI